MSRKLLTVAALTLLALPVATSHAQLGYGVAAGLSAPTGEFGTSVHAGYQLTWIVTFSAPLAPVGLRVEGSFNEFNYKSTILANAKARLLSGTANVVFSSPGILGPYLIGGLGMYNASTSCSGCNYGSTSKGGVKRGGRFQIRVGGFPGVFQGSSSPPPAHPP